MKFIVNPKIFADFNNPRIAITVVKDANNKVTVDEMSGLTQKLLDKLKGRYKSETLSREPKIAAWREAHRQFGSKPKDYPSSIEALYKRILKGGDLKPINPLVDIYNYISIEYMLPAGGEDINKMKGDLELTFASNNEQPVTVMGKDEAQAPKPGEVIYKDSLGTICRRWNWREVNRTILTEDTKNCVLVLEAIGPVSDDELRSAQSELGDLVEKYCQAQISHFIANKENSSFEIT